MNYTQFYREQHSAARLRARLRQQLLFPYPVVTEENTPVTLTEPDLEVVITPQLLESLQITYDPNLYETSVQDDDISDQINYVDDPLDLEDFITEPPKPKSLKQSEKEEELATTTPNED